MAIIDKTECGTVLTIFTQHATSKCKDCIKFLRLEFEGEQLRHVFIEYTDGGRFIDDTLALVDDDLPRIIEELASNIEALGKLDDVLNKYYWYRHGFIKCPYTHL